MSHTVTLSIPNISCHHCTMTIERETSDLPGVLAVAGDVETKSATFTLNDAGDLPKVKSLLTEIGYPSSN